MRRRTLALLSALVLIGVPISAQAYSVADVAGCYAAQFDGQMLLDPTTGQWVPENGLARFCADGAGNITEAFGFSKIAGCALVTYVMNGPSTYSIGPAGGGVVTMDVKSIAAQDLCQGAVPIPITPDEQALMSFRLFLDKDGAMHLLGQETKFPNNPVMPFLIEATSGTAWKQ